jgi:small subunit ribosomal protein S18
MSNYRRNVYYSRSKVCQFCNNKDIKIDYKNIDLLKHYIDDVGKIRPRRQTGTCAKHQREISKAIKNARHIALLPFTGE